jgi:two-component system, NarL family, response regulator LiaR
VLQQVESIELVGFVETCEQARTALIEHEPTVLLIDELFDEELVSLAQTLGTKTVLYTSESADPVLVAGLQSGVRACVQKGTTIALLISAIEAVANGAIWLDPVIGRRLIALINQEGKTYSRRSPSAPNQLSLRELEVLNLMCKGLANREIGSNLYISSETVKTHVRHIMEKMQVRSRTEAAYRAVAKGIINGN